MRAFIAFLCLICASCGMTPETTGENPGAPGEGPTSHMMGTAKPPQDLGNFTQFLDPKVSGFDEKWSHSSPDQTFVEITQDCQGEWTLLPPVCLRHMSDKKVLCAEIVDFPGKGPYQKRVVADLTGEGHVWTEYLPIQLSEAGQFGVCACKPTNETKTAREILQDNREYCRTMRRFQCVSPKGVGYFVWLDVSDWKNCPP